MFCGIKVHFLYCMCEKNSVSAQLLPVFLSVSGSCAQLEMAEASLSFPPACALR